MDQEPQANSTTNAPRKVRFKPKAPPKREQKPVLPKAEKTENDSDDAVTEQLLRKLNESSLKGRPKVEKKPVPVRVSFGAGGPSTKIRSYGDGKSINKIQGSSSNGGTEHRLEKEYKEPWNYYSYYPVTLPLRRPYSGNPELLDKGEFDENPEGSDYDEHATNSAAELGLMEDNLENNMIFLQLPSKLPITKQDIRTEVQGMDKNANPPKVTGKKQEDVKFDELQAGLMGKLLVYRSGAVKLKLGDTLYDVSAGLAGVFAQDVVAINTEAKHCCNLGELNKRSVVTPDIDTILDTISEL